MQFLLDPAILFFVLGVVAGTLKSNLEIPAQVGKFLSLYLLMALGLKGGFALAESGLTLDVLSSLLAAVVMAFVVPLIAYAVLKNRVARLDAAAVAAAYGSVSAVTFVTALQILSDQGLDPGGHMAVAMVLMESPALIVAVVLASMIRQAKAQGSLLALGGTLAVAGGSGGSMGLAGDSGGKGLSVGHIVHESLTNGAHVLLMGSVLIGYFTGEAGQGMMQPLTGDLFKGLLAFFLLDMGLNVARNAGPALRAPLILLVYALLAPLVHATLALGLGSVLNVPLADTILLMVLSASASYIVVPAALKFAIPEANPSLYLGLALGVTFPFNMIVGIPLYTWMAGVVLG